MSDLAEMRKQLRELRKDHVKPVSRMRKGDIISELERLKKMREETPASAAAPSAKSRAQHSHASNIKDAKMHEFPVKPAAEGTKKGMERKTARKAYEPEAAPKKKGVSKAALMKLLSEMSSSDEE